MGKIGNMIHDMRTFLESFSDNELALIEAVMYGGRDASTQGQTS